MAKIKIRNSQKWYFRIFTISQNRKNHKVGVRMEIAGHMEPYRVAARLIGMGTGRLPLGSIV